MVEREARCLALEQAYVHEVYHQMGGGDHRQHPPWPRVTQFLNQLEPGSIVCDVGCGSGKYLGVNPTVFSVGADRCSRLTAMAKEEQNEVLVCDNLSLPFRDESFDAVLSIAVVHHFATTERRIGAIKELARVLRIGGRLVISVWAMEQRHRKFESQDVLVPWHRPQTLSTPSLELTPTTTTSEEDSHHHLYAACMHTSDSDSCPSARGSGGRRRSKCKLKEVVPSPSSSSLSSPNESCYSFVRKALKKLAGVKRGGARSRPWFLESWTSCTSKEPPPRRYDPEGCEDIQDLPIELRRLEDDQDFLFKKKVFSCPEQHIEAPLNHKSKSLTDIIAIDQKLIVRSQSSVPSLEVPETKPIEASDASYFPTKQKKLVKQKQSVCDDDVDSEERDKATDMKDLVKSLPEFKIPGFGLHRRGNVCKQSSMNEELMSTERLREKERVRQNIQKQASLNEELIYRRNNNKTLDSLKDTLFSAATAKRFQIIKNGLTNKIKSSTTSIEKVSGASIKNGFVRILQGWTSGDIGIPMAPPAPPPPPPPQNIVEFKPFVIDGKRDQPGERRHSREDGSDSSKDSSLQSDTSVDSEDSFASVIFVPKSDQLDQQSTNTSPTLQSTPGSPQPTSPKIKFPPPISPKMKSASQISFALSHPSSPKLKHPGQLMSTTTPTSPKLKYFPQPTSPRPYQSSFLTSPTTRTAFKIIPTPNGGYTNQICKTQLVATKSLPTYYIPMLTPSSPTSDVARVNEQPVAGTSRTAKDMSDLHLSPSPKVSPELKDEIDDRKDLRPSITPGVSPTAVLPSSNPQINEEEPAKDNLDVSGSEPSLPPVATGHDANSSSKKRSGKFEILRLYEFSNLHQQHLKSQFPLVRRSATMFGRSDSPPSRSVPRLLSLDIFNPETDDMDSDSSGMSSPDSIGSVISIKNDDDSLDAKVEQKASVTSIINRTSGVGAEIPPTKVETSEECTELKLELEEPKTVSATTARLSPLLEAAADVASSLEETVDAVLQSSPQVKRKRILGQKDTRSLLQEDCSSNKSLNDCTRDSDRDSIQLNMKCTNPTVTGSSLPLNKVSQSEESQERKWDEECRQHLADFAEKLSEKLLAEIDRYREQSSSVHQVSPVCSEYCQFPETQDPYLSKLSEDLHNLTQLSIELQERSEVIPASQPSKGISISPPTNGAEAFHRVKGEGATMEEKHVENELGANSSSGASTPASLVSNMKRKSLITVDSKCYLHEEQIPLLHEYSDEPPGPAGTQFIIPNLVEPANSSLNVLSDNSAQESKSIRYNLLELPSDKYDSACSTSDSENKENSADLSDPESTESEGNWTNSRRNTILPNNKVLLNKSDPVVRSEVKKELEPRVSPNPPKEETTKIELLPAKDMPRRPSISVEMETSDQSARDKDEGGSMESNHLHLGISLESSEAGDISERTGSSSEGSRPGSRRETIQISDSGSILSLRPGLSVESSEAGDYSDKAGSDGSRDSRRDTASFGDITSSSQNSLLKPGNSVESSDAGDVSDRTGSDVSRQNTSSAGKTPSTASFTSDKASDCSKDARFADRRMARCDGRSSSEEMPHPRTCMNKLVRQRASTHEPPELLAKAQSCETSLSCSTSQDSLMSDSGGGAITFHRYYHVFKEGELDQLIERYVENLHIISSYYDHANWCVIAEKVQVWTI